MSGTAGGHHISDIIHPHHKGSDQPPADETKKNDAGQELDENGLVKQGDGSWDPSGQKVASDTIEDREKTFPHGSYEQDMEKKHEKEGNNRDVGEKTGGDKGQADESFSKNPQTDDKA